MADYATDYNLAELMASCVAREFLDGEVAFIGVGMPLIAALTAKFTHAPSFNMMVEFGALGPAPRRLMMCVACAVCNELSYATSTMREVMGAQQAGFVDVACISGAQIDKYGNLNSTVIGDYNNPKIRLAGSGGANDLASCAKRTVIMMRQEGRRFVNKCDYVTSPGYLTGPGAREKAGLPGGGPVSVVTTMGVYRFDPETKEMYLDSLHPGVDIAKVRDQVQWDLQVAPDLKTTEPPTREQVEVMRTLDPEAVYLGAGRMTLAGNFQRFVEMFENSYEKMNNLIKAKGII
ncbi:MAG: glutaconate CoA-transferase [Firmicutes bacterium]|nr:glutaconate CoA-transferase [Bacillota bacterium]